MKKMTIRPIFVIALCLTINQTANAQRTQLNRGLQSRATIQQKSSSTQLLEKLYQSRDYFKLIEEANKIIQSDPNNHVALYFRASAQIDHGSQTGNSKFILAGIKDSREAVQKSQQKIAQYYIPYIFGMTSLSTLEKKKSYTETAISIATAVLNNTNVTNETKANIYYQKGNSHLTINQPKLAISSFQSAIRLNAKHLASYSSLAEAYAITGDKARALGTYDQIILLFPTNPLSYNNRGMFYQQIKEYDKAIQDYTKTISLSPNYIYAFTNRGYTYMEQGNSAAAEKDFTDSLRINPQQPAIYNMRGSARIGLGKLKEAIEDHKQAIQLNPKNHISYTNLGFTFFYAAMYEKSEKSFQKSLSINPDQKYLTPWLYWISTQNNTTETTGAKLAKASLEKTPETRDWVDFLILRLLNKISDEELLNAVHKKEGNSRNAQICEAHFFLGIISWKESDPKSTREHFQIAQNTKAFHLSAYQGAVLGLSHLNKQENAVK